MKTVRFVHCADLHIDSPFKRISAIDNTMGELLYQSTYQSFSNIIDLALAEQVDCVLISGDVYDSSNRSLRAQLRFRNGLARLSDKGIPTYVVHGNHDPLNSWSSKLDWPSNVFIFPGDAVACVPLVKDGEIVAEICGISFSKRDVFDNLALRFPKERKTIPRIGLLHTNVGTNARHESYAPCTVSDLCACAIDYWALGHIHAYSILNRSNPAIVYSGCSQGTHPGEIDEKGCCLVTLSPLGDPDIQFVPTDTVRYQCDSVEISSCVTIDDIISAIEAKCEQVSENMKNRHTVIRLSLVGINELHSELRRGSAVADIVENVRDYFKGRTPTIWLEGLTLNTAGPYDLELLRHGNDFVSDIISMYDELDDPQSAHWKDVQERLNVLFTDWQGKKYLDKLSQSDVLALAKEARNWTLDALVRTS